MALKNPSLFLYGYKIDQYNSSLDFRATSGGPILLATLREGYYSLSSLMTEVVRALRSVDPFGRYFASADRTVSGGRENRITISTAGTHLDLLFASGVRSASSVAALLGFNGSDQTGALSYTGTATSGTAFVTDKAGYNFIRPEFFQGPQGSTNIAASGVKEAIVFGNMIFTQVQFKWIDESLALSNWSPFLKWATLQRSFEFTPDVSDPLKFHNCTLESTSEDSKGMRFKIMEMLPQFPNLYDTGLLKFRINN